MSRNKVESFDEKKSKTSDSTDRFKKTTIQSGIVFGALLVILITLFVIPKYKAYAENKEILREKIQYNLELPDEMSEKQYLEELKSIGDQLDVNRKSLPENIDTTSLYEGMVKMAESAQVGVLSIKFEPTDSRIDDVIGMRIEKGFLEKEEKTIQAPDGKFLTTCKFVVICSGSEAQIIAFLNELNLYQPIIRVLHYEIESDAANKKKITLELESYGIQEAEQINQKAGEEKID